MNKSEKNIFNGKHGIPWVRASRAKVKVLTRSFCQLRIHATLDVVLGGIILG